ncbi:hypothetical protein BN159_3832 [Streptomyces davaonensis JCM 4913]|uniref:Uncharacterized protein n=1 Tax=Streptomyces davaonensis (strain DSM 101723 / JCM 4913 / KCC S-0913 / 768) TaxID=1214101 RepID=K4QVV2_STRDJ|nr:hypothetical protein BN159_3832 [Streptomyces davaonensis JCM 4913]
MRFRFSVAENEQPPFSGFDLGHVDVWGSEGHATSRGGDQDQAMMIYLSLTLLLDGLREFLMDRSRGSYECAAVDSSFSLRFTRGRGRGRGHGAHRQARGRYDAGPVREALGWGIVWGM